MDGSRTIGTGSGVAIAIGNGVNVSADTSLVVSGTLTCNGHIKGKANGGWSYINISAGGGIEMGGNTGFMPAIYTQTTGTGPVRIVFNGTSGSRCFLRSATGRADGDKARIYITLGESDMTEWTWYGSDGSISMLGSYADVTDFGTTTTYGINLKNLWTYDTVNRPVLQHVKFTRCNLGVYAANTHLGYATAGLILRNCSFVSTPTMTGGPAPMASDYYLYGKSDDNSLRLELDTVGFDGRPYIRGLATAANCVFAKGYVYSTSSGVDAFAATWSGHVVGSDADGVDLPPSVTTSNCYYFHYYQDNPHLVRTCNGSNVYGCIFDAPLNAALGDLVMTGDGQGSLEISYNIVPPSMANSSYSMSPGKLVSNLQSTGTGSTFNIHHNTGCVQGSEGGLVGLGENSGGDPVGCVPYCRDNIAWSDGDNPGSYDVIICDLHGTTVDACGTVDYNGGWHLLSPSNNYVSTSTPATKFGYYGVRVSGSNFGTHDVNANPGFIDKTRNLIRWWREQSGDPAYVAAQTPAHDLPLAVAWLVSNPDQASTMMTWVKNGYKPTNSAYHNTGHDGSDIGAMPWTAPPATGISPQNLTEVLAHQHQPDILSTQIFSRSGQTRPYWDDFVRDVSADPVDARSQEWIDMLAGRTGPLAGNNATIRDDTYYTGSSFVSSAFQVVLDSSVRMITCDGRIHWDGWLETLNRAWPMPVPPIAQENNNTEDYLTSIVSGTDYHTSILIIGSDGLAKELHEWYQLTVVKDGGGNITSWDSRAYRKLDMAAGEFPADAGRVVTAGGMPMMPLFYNVNDLVRGDIGHALRFCINPNYVQKTYAWPATNFADGWNPKGFPFGTRFRIRADKLSGILARFAAYDHANGKPTGDGTGHAWVIVQGLAKYGMILDDLTGGTTFQISGCHDERSDTDIYYKLLLVEADDFEVVQVPRHISFSGPATRKVGESGTYTATVSGFPTGVHAGTICYFYNTLDPDAWLGPYNGWTANDTTPGSLSISFNYAGEFQPMSSVSTGSQWFSDPTYVHVIPDDVGTRVTLDDAMSNFGTSGNWQYSKQNTFPTLSKYGNFHFTNDPAAYCWWTWTGLTPGQSYRIGHTFFYYSNRTNQVNWSIRAGTQSGTVLSSGTFSQNGPDSTNPTGDLTYQGRPYVWLGSPVPADSSGKLTLRYDPQGLSTTVLAHADAAIMDPSGYIVALSATTPTTAAFTASFGYPISTYRSMVDNRNSGFGTSGLWTLTATGSYPTLAVSGDFSYTNDPTAYCWWTVSGLVPGGHYRVWHTYFFYSNRCTSVNWSIRDGDQTGTVQYSGSFNENGPDSTNPVGDVTYQGRPWNLLANSVTCGSQGKITVRYDPQGLTSSIYASADAIIVDPIAAPSVMFLTSSLAPSTATLPVTFTPPTPSTATLPASLQSTTAAMVVSSGATAIIPMTLQPIRASLRALPTKAPAASVSLNANLHCMRAAGSKSSLDSTWSTNPTIYEVDGAGIMIGSWSLNQTNRMDLCYEGDAYATFTSTDYCYWPFSAFTGQSYAFYHTYYFSPQRCTSIDWSIRTGTASGPIVRSSSFSEVGPDQTNPIGDFYFGGRPWVLAGYYTSNHNGTDYFRYDGNGVDSTHPMVADAIAFAPIYSTAYLFSPEVGPMGFDGRIATADPPIPSQAATALYIQDASGSFSALYSPHTDYLAAYPATMANSTASLAVTRTVPNPSPATLQNPATITSIVLAATAVVPNKLANLAADVACSTLLRVSSVPPPSNAAMAVTLANSTVAGSMTATIPNKLATLVGSVANATATQVASSTPPAPANPTLAVTMQSAAVAGLIGAVPPNNMPCALLATAGQVATYAASFTPATPSTVTLSGTVDAFTAAFDATYSPPSSKDITLDAAIPTYLTASVNPVAPPTENAIYSPTMAHISAAMDTFTVRPSNNSGVLLFSFDHLETSLPVAFAAPGDSSVSLNALATAGLSITLDSVPPAAVPSRFDVHVSAIVPTISVYPTIPDDSLAALGASIDDMGMASDLVKPDDALDILQYIDGLFNQTTALGAMFPGGIHFTRDESVPRSVRPFIAADILSETANRTSEPATFDDVRVQFTIVADSVGQARRLRKALARHLEEGLDNVADVDLGGGSTLISAQRAGGPSSLDPLPDPDGGDAVLCTVDYIFSIYYGV